MAAKYIFVTGGVVSGLGKGITAASLGRLLKMRGYKVTIQKFDPYINVDPGTMSPYQHGEVFVTDDGAETDLDLGHYERFIDENLSINSNVTTGKIYWTVLNKERRGGRENVMYIHVTLLPFISGSNELKTKPTQHSVKELLSIGIQPNVLVLRSDCEIPKDMMEKVASFCNVRKEDVIPNLTASSLYAVPLMLEEAGLAHSACHHLGLEDREPDLTEWKNMVHMQENATKPLTIGLVGKYVALPDAYISVMESIRHAGAANGADVHIELINSEEVTPETSEKLLGKVDGIVVPGGFGDRGIEGKIEAVRYAREHKKPYLGLCLGMQMAVIEFARNVGGLEGASSSEFGQHKYDVIDIMPDQKGVDMGGTMRLGLYPCKLDEDSISRELYGEGLIYERHRHRYEFNNTYREQLAAKGLKFAGLSPDGKLVEIVELPKDVHPWFVAVQFHPEFKSRPNRPHPLFNGFIKASLDLKK